MYGRSEAQELSLAAANFSLQFRVWYFPRTEDLDLAAFETKIRRNLIRIKVVACRDDAAIVVAKEFFGIGIRRKVSGSEAVAARPVTGPLNTPFQWTHD